MASHEHVKFNHTSHFGHKNSTEQMQKRRTMTLSIMIRPCKAEQRGLYSEVWKPSFNKHIYNGKNISLQTKIIKQRTCQACNLTWNKPEMRRSHLLFFHESQQQQFSYNLVKQRGKNTYFLGGIEEYFAARPKK